MSGRKKPELAARTTANDVNEMILDSSDTGDGPFCRSVNRRTFLSVAATASLASGCSVLGSLAGCDAASPRLPNILLIEVDDLGYGGLGCYRGKNLSTPHIDSLARSGVRCTNGYVTAPVCGPSRAGLLTGRYQQRFGFEQNTGSAQQQIEKGIGLPHDEMTLADALKDAGYKTGLIGKWHQGVLDEFHPLRRGFDEFFGFLPGGHDYLTWNTQGHGPIYRGTEPVEGDEYLTDAFSREAVDFIGRHSAEPFFLFLSYNAIHSPFQVPQKYLDRFPPPRTAGHTLAAMLSAVDDGVGTIVAALGEAGIEKHTIVFFVSDNGGSLKAGAHNGGLRGGKGSLYEGGIRVPFIAAWPHRLSPGVVYEPVVSTLDLLPTMVAAAGGKPPDHRPTDGVNLIPHLSGKEHSSPHEALFWRIGDRYAVRAGQWKLVRRRRIAQPALYDLSTDPAEALNLAIERPDVVDALLDSYSRWEQEMIEPLWTSNTHPIPENRIARMPLYPT